MCRILLQTAYFFIIIVSLCIVQSRKYDIEAESQKLYGEDLKGALRKFRKSYDYSQILQEKSYNLEAELMDSFSYLEDYYAPHIEKKAMTLLGLKEDGTKRAEERKPIGRQNEGEIQAETTKSDVQLLDEYVAYKRQLTVPEINSFANLGFEFAGKIIHGMLNHMGGNDVEGGKSTKLPTDDKDVPAKTSHDHSVTNEGTFISTAKPEVQEPDDEKFLFRAKNEGS